VFRVGRTRVDASTNAAPPLASSRLIASRGADLPMTVGWLALLIIGGALVALSVDVVPYWTIDHHGVDLAVGVAMLPVGITMFLLRRHASEPTIHAGLIVGIVCITGSVWAVGPSAESQAPALFYGFLSAFACVYLTRRQAVGYLTFAGVLYLGALLSHWRADMASQWVMNMFAMVVPCLTISVLVGRLRDLALHDALTGLANRRMLEECLPLSMAAAARTGAALTVVAIDLDNLKTVNDTAGHAAGDRMIVEATQRWSIALRTTDVFARVGGDEFVIVMPAADVQQAESVVERLRDVTPDVRFSAGIALWEGEAGHQLLHRADGALYTAKTGGRNRTVIAPHCGGTPTESSSANPSPAELRISSS
jgi:diguanylate cyclase (GGDEF)-like protein